ncbi:50S ribosomal protein L13, partial [bacterium]|nr:50S ribosomal protein L13 [bacterium]
MEKTYSAKKDEIKRKWYIIDAKGKVLGKVAVKAATILRGKHKPIYTPHVDTGDHVIVINASQVVLTGKKLEQKYYRRHSGYPGGLKSIRYDKLLKEKPEKVIELAIRGMLPKTKLGRAMLKKLRVYKGSEH